MNNGGGSGLPYFFEKETIMAKSVLDPVFRCDSCHKLVLLETLHKVGACPKCGNKRMRNVTVFDNDEKAQMEKWNLQAFLSDFSEVKDVVA
jgi:Zn finger protein HypA/HybF involved in hydrogenase expression